MFLVSVRNMFFPICKPLFFLNALNVLLQLAVSFLRPFISLAMFEIVLCISLMRLFFSASKFACATFHSFKSFCKDFTSSSVSWHEAVGLQRCEILEFFFQLFPAFLSIICAMRKYDVCSSFFKLTLYILPYIYIISDGKRVGWCWHINQVRVHKFSSLISKEELRLLAFPGLQKPLEASINPVKLTICSFCEKNYWLSDIIRDH